MTSYSSRGFFNAAYHDSETLEMDRRSWSKPPHTNPYAREEPVRWGGRLAVRDEAAWGASGGSLQEERLPRDHIPTGAGAPSFPHQPYHNSFPADNLHYQSAQARLPSLLSDNMTMRMRGIAMRRMSMFPHASPADVDLTENAIRNEMENGLSIVRPCIDLINSVQSLGVPVLPAIAVIRDQWLGMTSKLEALSGLVLHGGEFWNIFRKLAYEQNLVKELVGMSTLEQTRAIRELPMSFEEKKSIRNKVLAFRSVKKSYEFTWFAELSENSFLFFRRCSYTVRSARQALQLWHGIMKEIGGKFGSSVLTYFMFLKWLLLFNIFSFVVNFSFITIPLLVYDPNITSSVSFRGLELLTGAGYFTYTVMYYGAYSNQTLEHGVEYNLQLAYFFTIVVYMVLCGIALIFSMASSFKKNFVLVDQASTSAWQLLCSWDFSVTSEKTVTQRKNNLRVQLKESLSEKAQQELLTLRHKLKHSGIHLGSWFVSTALVVGCAASIFFLCRHEGKLFSQWGPGPASPQQEAETLLVPFVVSLMNLVIPHFFSLFNKWEHYSNTRSQIYTLVVRNVFLRMSILGVLCYYWMNEVALRAPSQCWESVVGQALYRLVIIDFLFLMLGSFFGEFLWNVIGTKLHQRLGPPEFDVARNVLDLIYAQTLAWIGIYFSPLLPSIQILKFFILFYLKKVSLTQNCQPPRRTGRAAQMQTIFIFLLFFPFYVGAISIVGYTTWSLKPSKTCGPFRGLNKAFSVVEVWMDGLQSLSGSSWAIWIYENIIRSEIFYFLITLIILGITYIFYQLIQGRKELIGLLKQRIVNEGKDKSFLLDKLQNLQKSRTKKDTKQNNDGTSSHQHSLGGSSRSQSDAVRQALLARQQAEQEEVTDRNGVSVPADISTSSALMQAMLARQRAERESEDFCQRLEDPPTTFSALSLAMEARQRAEGEMVHENYRKGDFYENATSNAVSQAMQARLKAEEEPPVSSIMMQVMQARQQSEQEAGMQWAHVQPQNPAASGSSALIQAMLARQQAQNEYDDGY